MKGRVPRRDTSSLRVKGCASAVFRFRMRLSGDASSADGNAAEDSVVNEAPRLPSITEGLIVSCFSYSSSRTEMTRHQLRCQRFAICDQEHQSLILRATVSGACAQGTPELLDCQCCCNARCNAKQALSLLYSRDQFHFSGNHIRAGFSGVFESKRVYQSWLRLHLLAAAFELQKDDHFAASWTINRAASYASIT